jgi:hypothetical protein
MNVYYVGRGIVFHRPKAWHHKLMSVHMNDCGSRLKICPPILHRLIQLMTLGEAATDISTQVYLMYV